MLNEYFTYIVPHIIEKVDCIQTDAGTQFSGNECERYKVKCRSCPTDYQALNGQVERSIGILAMKMRALLMERSVPNKYWPLALEAASYLLNRTLHASLNGMSPLESSTGEKPNLRHARVFGCAAFVQIPKSLREGKLGAVAWKGTLMGYSTSSPEWLVLNLQTLQVRKAYSVRFIESESGFACRHSKQGLIECEDMPVSIIESELVCDENNTPIVKNIKETRNLVLKHRKMRALLS